MEKQHFHGHRKRLRERFLKGGLDPFADYEAVELLLTLAIPYKDAKVPAKVAVDRFGSLRGVLDAPLEELRKISGMGEVGAVALRIIRETANRYHQQKSQEAFSLSDEKIGLGAEESRVNEGLRRLSRKAVANAIRREEDQ